MSRIVATNIASADTSRLPAHVWRQWVSCPIPQGMEYVEMTREPRADHPTKWVAEVEGLTPDNGRDSSLYWRPWLGAQRRLEGVRREVEGSRVMPEAAGTPQEAAPEAAQVDVLGNPLVAGELYVSTRGGGVVPVSVEGVRWLVDRLGRAERR